MNAPLDLALRPADQDVKRVVQKLADDFGARAMTARATREQHGHGEGLADAGVPDVVVFPHSNEEVASIVRLCHGARVPVIAFGVGTSLEGHVAAIYGGVCMDFAEMNRVLVVNAEDLDCRVQAGVTREQLNAELKGTGLFFPDRSRRKCDDRGHDRHPGLRHQRRALRHDARERAGPHGRDR